MRRIVVTGGAGFIGSHIVDALVKRGDAVCVINNLVTGFESNLDEVKNDIEFIQADIGDSRVLQRALRGVDCVIHQAALASVPLSIDYPMRVNEACVTGTLSVLDQARLAGVRRVVYAGSSSCYGDRPFSANRESDTPMTISPYAVAKLAGEYYCHAFAHSYSIETVSLRYFNVFGPRQDPNSHYSAVIPRFITRILEGKRPIIYGDGRQSRDFTFVGNIVACNLLAMDATNVSGRSYNVADGRAIALLELIACLGDALGVEVTPEFQDPRPGDILHSMADITLATRELNYQPKTDFRTGLEHSIDYYRKLASQSV